MYSVYLAFMFTLFYIPQHKQSLRDIATGLHLVRDDSSRDYMDMSLQQIEFFVRRNIRFAKAVPGFRDLDMHDQITLFKGDLKWKTIL